MKSTFILIASIFIISPLIGNGQVKQIEPLTFTEVIHLDSSLTENEIYLRAKTWFAKTYNSAQDVIQMDDKENGRIIGKGKIRYLSSVFAGSNASKGWISYTITLDIRKGRYKYTITDFIHEGNPFNDHGAWSFGLLTTEAVCPFDKDKAGVKWRNRVWVDIKSTAVTDIMNVINSLKIAMNQVAKIDNDDW